MDDRHFGLKLVLAIFLLSASLSLADARQMSRKDQVVQTPYFELPLGSVHASGWLLTALERQREGMTSRMDELYPSVMGPRNGWLGGDGDQWERGPYWIDGLLPLAYILDDDSLKAKAKPWIEWALDSQQQDGFFGPKNDYPPEKGLQRNNSKDWWPRMVVLKIMQQYYSATSDERAISFLTNYFRYQYKTLSDFPLGYWTSWAEFRSADNLQVVIWLYRLTGEEWLLDLGDILHSQGVDFTHIFLDTDEMKREKSIHGVNLAQGIKEPVVYWQEKPDDRYLRAAKKGLEDIREYDGFANGMFGADEMLHGNDPTQGSELCSAVELMFSLEEMMRITGDLDYVDQLERIAFNALPAQISDDFTSRQYYQQANQVLVSRDKRRFYTNHGETDLLFGFLTGYPCCTANLHQGWPKFTQNLWLGTPDGGLAALVYSPSEVNAKVRGGSQVRIIESTAYPMDGRILLTLKMDAPETATAFPLKLRIPSWAEGATVRVNGKAVSGIVPGSIAVLDFSWRDGDRVELSFPMKVTSRKWFEGAVSVERGPLVYALKIREEWQKKAFDDGAAIHGKDYWEIYPKSKWNYGLLEGSLDNPSKAFRVSVDRQKLSSEWYWNQESAPIEIRVKAKEIPSWKLEDCMAGPMPRVYATDSQMSVVKSEWITLIPYGCTKLRISEFPVIGNK